MARFWRHDERLSPYDDDAFTEEELDSICQTVRESSFIDDGSGRSIDERMTEFFGGSQPGWIGFQAPDAACYVNCYGVLRRGRQAIRVELQFELSDDLESFALTGLSVNNRPQPEQAVADFEASFAAEEPGGYEEKPEEDEYPDRFADRTTDDWYEGGDGDFRDRERLHHPAYDFEADYVEPVEEEKPERPYSQFGSYGAFPVQHRHSHGCGCGCEHECEDDDDDCEE